MTPRWVDAQARKDWLLAMTIGYYIESVSPVGSACIVKKYNLDLSPATIRNILAELEQEGFLMHPHTSAGRVPTQQGYRYYVDNLMQEIQLLEEEKLKIKSEYNRQTQELESLLEKTSQVISEITQCTSLISVDGWGAKLFCKGTRFVVEYPQEQDINEIKSILMALDEKEKLLEIINRGLNQRVEVFIGHEIACREIESCSLVVSQYKTTKGPAGRIAVLGPTRMDYERVVSALDYFSELMEEIL
ncbi:Heat-inducible transcription repressor HrcA [hydrothermal vent metagenome]|uniref:Heat-inducible transcription repressor HrcA n=1 Tax=hydrothermal vent metagenome TaxID=652676 RepID=A0A3B1DLL2_9ZZZZ